MATNRKLVPVPQHQTALARADQLTTSGLVPSGGSAMVERTERRIATEASGIVGTGQLGVLAQRGAAVLHGHAYHLQQGAVDHVWDAVDDEVDPRKQSYLAGIADQTIHQLNADLQDITDDAVRRIRGIIQRDGVPPADNRPGYVKAVKQLPDE